MLIYDNIVANVMFVAHPRACSRVAWMDMHRWWIFKTTRSSQWNQLEWYCTCHRTGGTAWSRDSNVNNSNNL